MGRASGGKPVSSSNQILLRGATVRAQGRGEPLAKSVREFFEPRFGRDFSSVRIHADETAAQSAKSVQASAYTVGRDITFAKGQYAPDSNVGRRLIAHELAHVVQQSEPGADVALMRSPDTGLLEEPVSSVPMKSGTVTSPARIDAPSSPGWESVDPQYLLISSGEPFELPHRLRLNYLDDDGCKSGQGRWEAREGRYDGKDVCVADSALVASSSVTMSGSASAKFDIGAGEFYYGGKGPVEATTDADNPVPKGMHDIEIPDFQHKLGAKYGDYATTWFRLGHSGDRYLHPGRVSLGCTTIKQTSEWPKIWEYLISSRKDRQSVGELEVV